MIRGHADEWYVDPERIAVAGFSAGANLCGTFATRWYESWLGEHFSADPASFRPVAAILGYGLNDYAYQEAYNAAQKPNPMLMASNEAFFGSLKPTQEQLREASPSCHVSEKTPPIFMMHAANDSMVPVYHSIRMAEVLNEAKVPFELHIFQNGEHGFATGAAMGASVYRSDQWRACGAWMDLAKTWLLHIVAPETQEHDISAADFFEEGEQKPFSFPGGF